MNTVEDLIDDFKKDTQLNIIYSSSLFYGILSFIVALIVHPISKTLLSLSSVIIVLSLSLIVIIHTKSDIDPELISTSIGLLFFFIGISFIIYFFTYTCVSKTSKATKNVENKARLARKKSEEYSEKLFHQIKNTEEKTKREVSTRFDKFTNLFKASGKDKFNTFLKKNVENHCKLKKSNFGNTIDNEDIFDLGKFLNYLNISYKKIGKWNKQYEYCKPFYYAKFVFIIVYTIAVIEYFK